MSRLRLRRKGKRMSKHTWIIVGLVVFFLYMNGSLTSILTPTAAKTNS